MKITFDLFEIELEGYPYEIRFQGHESEPKCSGINGSDPATKDGKGGIFIQSDYQYCGIGIQEDGEFIRFNQTVEIIFGNPMNSDLVYRSFKHSTHASCLYARNQTNELSFNVFNRITQNIIEGLLFSLSQILRSGWRSGIVNILLSLRSQVRSLLLSLSSENQSYIRLFVIMTSQTKKNNAQFFLNTN